MADAARWGRRAIAVGLVLGAAWAALAWALPPLLKSQIEARGGEWLGRRVGVERVEVSLAALKLTLHGLRVEKEVPGAEPQLALRRLFVDAEWRSLWKLAPVLRAVELDAPRLQLQRRADGTDVDDVLARLSRPADAVPEPDTVPPRFALYNLRVTDGALRLDDRAAAAVHELGGLRVGLPFLSNLPADVEVEVEPELAFDLNGAAFASTAVSTPFADDRKTRLELRFEAVDVAPYQPYLQSLLEGLPVRLRRARLGADLAVDFEVDADRVPVVRVSGRTTAVDVAIDDTAGARLLDVPRLEAALTDVQPLARRAMLQRLSIDGATLHAHRDAAGRLNLLALARRDAPVSPGIAASAAGAGGAASAAGATSAAGTAKAAPGGWAFGLQRFELVDATLRWRDDAVRPAVDWRVAPVSATTGAIAWPATAPVPVAFEAQWAADTRAPTAEATRLRVEGEAGVDAAALRAEVQRLRLSRLAPYLANVLAARLDGRADVQAALDWAAVRGDAPGRLVLSAPAVRVGDLTLGGTGRTAAARWQHLQVSGVRLDALQRHVEVGDVTLRRPEASLHRDAAGQWNVARLFAGPSDTTPPPSSPASPGWSARLGRLRIDGARLRFVDERPTGAETDTPVRLELHDVALDLRQLAWPARRGTPPASLRVDARLRDPGAAQDAADATIAWRGRVQPWPLRADGTLDAVRLPLHAVVPYLGDAIDVDVAHAEADWRGALQVEADGARWTLRADGDAVLADVHVHEPLTATGGGAELIGWERLALQKIALRAAAGERPDLRIDAVELSDFFSKLVIDERGRFNLQDVAARDDAEPDAGPKTRTEAAFAPATETPWPIDLAVGGVSFVNGHVDFTDRYIRPNYSADLSRLQGRLGAFSSSGREMAVLELNGRAAGSAELEIRGALNPAVRPPVLDLQARATGLELAPLSPYAGKYAGYAIERGKLSVDVAYRIDADGRLDAKNQVVLDQLTFGEKVDSPSATKLPIRLALALLADRHGVIDVNLPISGSINDPQFSVWGLVWRMIGNLIVKVVTAPFAALAGGGGPDLSQVGFVAGTSALAADAAAGLDRVAQALTDRPALRLTVTGVVDPAAERDAMQLAALEARIVAEHRRQAVRAGAAADAPLPAPTPEQRERIVQRLYRDTPLPDRPRNLLGLLQSLPLAQMQARLAAAVPAGDDAARELALQRALAVRDALVARGLPAERLFVGAPRVRGADAPAAASASASAAGAQAAAGGWSPRAELSLALR
ncbi:MAG: DUF748 domain-containing protein [Gammaproteobacteria bacterium]